MNKTAIWLIVGLMSLALLGSVLLQLYWINDFVQLNRDQFNHDVSTALENISKRLEQVEDDEMWKGLSRDIYSEFNPSNRGAAEFTAQVEEGFDTIITKEKLLAELHQEQCSCSTCVKERELELLDFKRKQVTHKNNLVALEERLPNLPQLKKIIDQELSNKNIDLDYKYGVYSKNKKGFILKDGHYLVNDFGPQGIPMGDTQLLNTKYKGQLYTRGVKSPGFLAIYFPNLTSEIWKSAWKMMLAALISTGIILFCFIYTIQVIFRQKKLGEMKTDFINNMTHEFKTPIATISLAADSITSSRILNNPDKVSRFADIIKQENRRMLNQVEKVLQMAQLDKENFSLNITSVNLHNIIEQAVQNSNLQVEKKGGMVEAKLDATKDIIQGDLTHITNIVHNLLDNANKYSPKEPQILVSTRNFSNGIEMTVKDNGIGMDREAVKHIFDKFYRVHTGNLHDVKGFGLGLSYVHTMVTAHNGNIDVKSELGKGSSFIIFLPFKHRV